MNVLHIKWLLYYRKCVFSVLELDARYDWRVMAPNTHHSLFPMSLLCVLTRITWKLQVIYGHSAYQMTVPLSETFLVCLRVAWEILLERYSLRHAPVVLETTLCACTASLYIHRYLVRSYAWQQTPVPYHCILHTKRRLHCQQHIVL